MDHFICKPCDKVFTRILLFNAHLKSETHNKKIKYAQGNEKIIKCDVCNITCNSSVQYDEHIKGEQHLKRFRKDLIFDLNVDENIPFKDSPVKKEESLKVYNNNLKNYYCDLCNMICTGPIPYQAHINSKQHKKKSEAKNHNDDTCLNISEAKPLNNEINLTFCEAITDSISSNSIPFEDHNQNENALNKLKMSKDVNNVEKSLEDGVNKESNPFYCKFCKITCNGPVPFKAHLASEKHLKKVNLSSLNVDFSSGEKMKERSDDSSSHNKCFESSKDKMPGSETHTIEGFLKNLRSEIYTIDNVKSCFKITPSDEPVQLNVFEKS